MSHPKFLLTWTGTLFVLVLAGAMGTGALAESGKATVYSSSFQGKKTASGQKFSQGKMTAASKTLPLGSKVKVKNKKTGKSATVTINDREGKNGKGVVDLSKAAANKVGVKGTAPVDAHVVAKGNGKINGKGK